MADLIEIRHITIDTDKLTARVHLSLDAPIMTSEDVEATARIYYMAPGICNHLCLGDAGKTFQACMGHTELPHLLEHLAVEIMNQTGLAGKIACGRTRKVNGDSRLYDIELSCPDDVLTVGALSSAVFIMDWAFFTPDLPAPNFEATCQALHDLAISMGGYDDNCSSNDKSSDDECAQDLNQSFDHNEHSEDSGTHTKTEDIDDVLQKDEAAEALGSLDKPVSGKPDLNIASEEASVVDFVPNK